MASTRKPSAVQPDRSWHLTPSGLAVVGWLFLLAGIISFAMAKPATEIVFDRHVPVNLNKPWDADLIWACFLLMMFGFFSSIIGLLVNARSVRRGEQFLVSLILLNVASLIGIMGYIILV